MAIRVLIADDQEMVRAGFRAIVDAQPDMEVVADAPDGVVAVAEARRLKPDVCLFDIRMPRLDGLEATRTLLAGANGTGPRIVVVTTFDTDEYVYGALRSGATGFLLKDSGPTLLVEAVRAAASGESLISPSVTVRLLERLTEPVASGPKAVEVLTERELDVVELAARGKTNAEIAEALFVSVSTVKTHLEAVRAKLGVRNRVGIAAWAWEHGVVG
ncbi:response regulator transcription factor [Glycomyces sp. TRM65418]|uniref:response regulator n=1 Tax=Glycomyces sp. TRM65418 TaxID=2867006 RepID=UPI001CE52A46|nr:response regulator transcription factor [Glycomyces sp. TRM65418]MCC3763287.1 response regulator transcription factor [Glycomyces sp. TRM65418]QZD57287.1 response regulator transcription factor [Glycomyces sp. TRM65418]